VVLNADAIPDKVSPDFTVYDCVAATPDPLGDGSTDGGGVFDGLGAMDDDEGAVGDGVSVTVDRGEGDPDGLALTTAAADPEGPGEAAGELPRRAKRMATKAIASRPTRTI
jgi:hypothetical protein